MELSLDNIVDNLIKIDDLSWGLYQLEFDFLLAKIKKDEIDNLVLKSVFCGQEEARKLKEKYIDFSVQDICNDLGLKVEYKHEYSDSAGRLVYALFTPPKKITIIDEPLSSQRIFSKDFTNDKSKNFMRGDLVNLLMAHELYHFIEDVNKKTIFTRSKQITLWKLFGYQYKSRVVTTSEIAAMAFARELTNYAYSPFVLDIVLMWGYNSDYARLLYNDIISFMNENRGYSLEIDDTKIEIKEERKGLFKFFKKPE